MIEITTGNYIGLYEKINYKFNNEELLTTALSHPSLCYSQKNKCVNYERLELLGDSVLSLIVLELLLNFYPDYTEGDIAKRKSNLVCTSTLAKLGSEIDIGRYIYMTKGEEKMDGRNNPRILENVIEAIIGAVYSDGGLNGAKQFVNKYWTSLVKGQKTIEKDPKTRLQEWLQKNKYRIPKYKTVGQNGPESNPVFEIEIQIESFPKVKHEGKNKREAEIACAVDMIEYIKNNLDKNI